ncbi:MAG: lamin tail domain-containing protein, partial [Planctomycetales bacterium]|nr:lamin tail domain-containing protein [Planctomycetales bacterium]
MSRTRRGLRVEKLDERILLARDSVYISEFLANNDSALADKDGYYSDWIELHNPTPETVNLSNWALTDSPDDHAKWRFPAITIPANGYQIVYASGNNRRSPTDELHTNFKLSTDGEYLALVRPDQSIADEYEPAYPPQFSDISYGPTSTEISLAPRDAVRTFKIPTENDSRDASWRENVAYDDSAWQQARGAIGYSLPGLDNGGFEQQDLSSWQNRGPVDVVDDEFGLAPTNGNYMAVATTKDSSATRAGAEFYLGIPRSSLDTVNVGDVQSVATIKREITVREGSVITFDWNFLTNELRNGDFAFAFVSDSTSILQLANPESTLFDSSAVGFAKETRFHQFTHVASTAGTYTLGIGVAQAIDLNADSALVIDNLQIDGTGDDGPSYESILDTRLPVEAIDNTSVWMRQEFQYDPRERLQDLQLRVQYDDGFVAFINGIPIASRNAPQTLAWNSAATKTHSNHDAMEFQDITVPNNVLVAGTNLLAIHGLNAASNTGDFLLDAELVAVSEPSNQPSFLLHPTPGGPNLSATFEAGFAEPVGFDHPHGYYDEPFLLAMSSVTSGATIYYTTDGSDPTGPTGRVYSDPILIESTTIVRAVVVRDGAASREFSTASYLFVSDTIKQSDSSAIAAGFPDTWPDYEMDPDVIGSDGQDLFGGKYTSVIEDALLSLPSMSLVLNREHLFGDQGIFDHPTSRGADWERPTSVELFDPDGTSGFQLNAGVRIHGGISRTSSDKQ